VNSNSDQPIHHARTKEVALSCGVQPATIRRWADDKKIPHFRTPGGHLRFNLSEIEAWKLRSVEPPVLEPDVLRAPAKLSALQTVEADRLGRQIGRQLRERKALLLARLPKTRRDAIQRAADASAKTNRDEERRSSDEERRARREAEQ
jgi:excisionase family DNA binding protein